ncbi:hypothetical protein UFOVP56_39 [uncultured Caudovirales phage]|uniref:Uncharacterized protein n=1 Tax=uncultured Caudovirales phage TaxID=2100421 RepID=A0A6J5T9W7_9CAUD|nr:hypothetical protein UFOVP56_39 [uncultured Caudovirales phage]
MLQSQFNALVNADIQRLMQPKLKQFVVTVNYSRELFIVARDEQDAIDKVIDTNAQDLRVLNCNDLEVLV